jgi:hypothetical protein
MTNRHAYAAALAAALAVAACSSGNPDPKTLPAPATSRPLAQTADPCPTQGDDVHVRAEIFNGGVALVFYATDSAQVGPLRDRVHALAAQNPAGAEGMTTSVTDTSDGARIDFVPRDQDPDALAALRDRIEVAVDQLEDGDCTVRVSAR